MAVTNAKTTLFVGGLLPGVDEQLVTSAFIPFGDIVKVQLPLDNETQLHRGFAFVEFEDPNDCKEAIENMHLSELNGKLLKVSLARPGKYQEIQEKAVWEDEDFIKKRNPDTDKLPPEPEVAPGKPKIQKKEIGVKQRNPRVFFDISIEKQAIGRIEMELFADIVPCKFIYQPPTILGNTNNSDC